MLDIGAGLIRSSGREAELIISTGEDALVYVDNGDTYELDAVASGMYDVREGADEAVKLLNGSKEGAEADDRDEIEGVEADVYDDRGSSKPADDAV